MKVDNINNRLSVYRKPSFGGFDVKKDEYGEKLYNFSYPYDSKRYNCYLQIVSVKRMPNGDYKIGAPLHNFEENVNLLKLNPGDNKIDLNYAYRLGENQPFAYQYQLKPVNYPDAIPMFKVDAGDVIDETKTGGHKIYNLVVPSGAVSNNAGAAILIGTDNYDVRWVYDKNHNIVPNPKAQLGLDATKDFANQIGGTAAGLEHAIDSGELDVYSKIFLLPFATGDRTSRHFYWLESGFQLSNAMDNIQTYARIQQKLFAKGKNLVSDAAITSEGLSGIHFQSILHYGADNVFFDWFKCDSLKDSTAKIGAFGKKNSFIRHKLVNAPFVPEQNANGKVVLKPCKYNPKEPTYVQIYNVKQVSDDQMKAGSPLIEGYGKPATEAGVLQDGTHNDTVMAYAYPIDPKVYKKNVELFNEYNRKRPVGEYVSINSYEATRMLTKFENFEFENKFEGGFYTWDANVDMVKYHYTLSNSDLEGVMHLPLDERKAAIKKIQQKNCEVQDYAVSSVQYWAKKTNQILNLYTAQALKNVDEEDPATALKLINRKISEHVLPEKLSYELNEDIVANVQSGNYTLHGMDSVENMHDTVLEGLMEFPLESAELGKDILSLFSTPYITKRATQPDQIGKSRMEMLLANNPHLTKDYEALYNRTTHMYSDTMYDFAKDILTDINKRLPKDRKLNIYEDTSPYGKYVLPLLTQEIAKFAVMKGLMPELDYQIDSKNGGIIYDYDASRKSSLKSLGITSISQKRDADALISKLNSGIKHIKESDKKKLADALYKMIEGTNLTSFMLAEMIVDRAKGGLDFRFDAAKDVSDMDSLRNSNDLFEDNWKQVIGFWKNATDAIYKENPNSYLVAEITDELDLHRMGAGHNSEDFVYYKEERGDRPYEYRNDIVRKFLRDTGITATANYNFFFTSVAGIFGKLGENGNDWGTNQGYKIHNLLKKGRGGEEFLFSGPYESVLKSYTFVDNHDKPRILHILSMDMGLFYADLNDIGNFDYRRRAYAVLHPEIGAPNDVTREMTDSYDYSYISSKAIARGESLNSAFYRALDEMTKRKDSKGVQLLKPELKDSAYRLVKEVVAKLAAGEYNGKIFEADNLGAEELQKLIGLVMRNVRNNSSLSNAQADYLEAEVFVKALDPAMSKALPMDKFLINLPGIPTTYAGDDYGATGYETKTKNIYLKNRAAVHHDWTEKYEFIRKHKANEDNLKLFRSRPVLHALNDGAPFLLPLQHGSGREISGLLRYATDGNAVLSLFNVAGNSFVYDKYSDASKEPVYMDQNRINLSKVDDFTGLNAGLTPGMEFINIYNPNDKYYVYQDGGEDNYYLAHKDKNDPIVLKDNVLTLYSASDELKQRDKEFMAKVKKARENKVSFCGNRKVLYNPQYSISTSAYDQVQKLNNEVGAKLAIVSR